MREGLRGSRVASRAPHVDLMRLGGDVMVTSWDALVTSWLGDSDIKRCLDDVIGAPCLASPPPTRELFWGVGVHHGWPMIVVDVVVTWGRPIPGAAQGLVASRAPHADAMWLVGDVMVTWGRQIPRAELGLMVSRVRHDDVMRLVDVMVTWGRQIPRAELGLVASRVPHVGVMMLVRCVAARFAYNPD